MEQATQNRRGADRSLRGTRLRAPLLLTLWVTLAFEAIGGLVIFCARLVAGATPGEGLHVVTGAILALIYGVYQWRHWIRVRPWRARLDSILGLIAAVFMALTLLSGLALGIPWWRQRIGGHSTEAVPYPPALAAFHNIASMVVLTFVGAHLGAVLMRDRGRG